jgi:hypothetical protein
MEPLWRPAGGDRAYPVNAASPPATPYSALQASTSLEWNNYAVEFIGGERRDGSTSPTCRRKSGELSRNLGDGVWLVLERYS